MRGDSSKWARIFTEISLKLGSSHHQEQTLVWAFSRGSVEQCTSVSSCTCQLTSNNTVNKSYNQPSRAQGCSRACASSSSAVLRVDVRPEHEIPHSINKPGDACSVSTMGGRLRMKSNLTTDVSKRRKSSTRPSSNGS